MATQSPPGLIDPRIYQGPFSDILTQPAYIPPGPKGYSGLGGTREAVLKLATDFLGGVSEGRLRKFQEGENQKAQALEQANAYMAMATSNNRLTEEAVDELKQKYSEYVGQKVNQELQQIKPDTKTPMGSIMGVLKHFASNLAGTPPKGMDVDVEGLRSLVTSGGAYLKDPTKLRQTYVDQAFSGLQSSVAEARKAAEAAGRPLAMEDVQQSPGFQQHVPILVRYGGPELAQAYVQTATGGLPSADSMAYLTRGLAMEGARPTAQPPEPTLPSPMRFTQAPPPTVGIETGVGAYKIPSDMGLPRLEKPPAFQIGSVGGGFIEQISSRPSSKPMTPELHGSFVSRSRPGSPVVRPIRYEKLFDPRTGLTNEYQITPGMQMTGVALQGGVYDLQGNPVPPEVASRLTIPRDVSVSDTRPSGPKREVWTVVRDKATGKEISRELSYRASPPEVGQGRSMAEQRTEKVNALYTAIDAAMPSLLIEAGFAPSGDWHRNALTLVNSGYLAKKYGQTDEMKGYLADVTRRFRTEAAALQNTIKSGEGTEAGEGLRRFTVEGDMFGDIDANMGASPAAKPQPKKKK